MMDTGLRQEVVAVEEVGRMSIIKKHAIHAPTETEYGYEELLVKLSDGTKIYIEQNGNGEVTRFSVHLKKENDVWIGFDKSETSVNGLYVTPEGKIHLE